MFRRDIFKEEIEKGQRKIRPYKELDITGHTYGGDSQRRDEDQRRQQTGHT